MKSHHLGTAGRVFGTKELVLHKNHIVVYRIKDDEAQTITILHSAQK